MNKTKKHYYEEAVCESNLANHIHDVQRKMDFMIESHKQLIESHKQLIDTLNKLLPYQLKHFTKRQEPISPAKPEYIQEYIQQSNHMMDSSFQNSAIMISHLSPSMLNHYAYESLQNMQENLQENQEFIQRVEQYQFLEHSAMFQSEERTKSQSLLQINDQKVPEIQLDQPQKILKLLEPQFKMMNLNFKSCECLYFYPQMKNQPFYQKITDCNNILFLGVLKNHEVIGAFTEVGFSSKVNLIPKDNPKCCLFNLTKKHFLYAQRTNKTHSCDKSYILFGNWEYKIKVGDSIMHSDLGKRGDCFKKYGYGANQKQVDNTREWIFGQLWPQENYQLQKYMICALK